MTSREFRDRVIKRGKKADVQLTAPILEQLEAYYRLLARWNDKINLTALPLKDLTDQAVDRLLIEPLAAARYVPETAIMWFDLGSGGGSPALPLKMVRPLARLSMVESKTKKAAFLREAVRALGLRDATVEAARFEEFARRQENLGAAELVTVRAVRLNSTFYDAARALLGPSGSLLLFSSYESAAKAPSGFEVSQVVRLSPVARNIGSTPSSQVVILRRI
jgi:16S rRNA (guanine527-N7)-methyltransferase